ncbi:MAG: signal peptidase II [Myxococcales bacterium]|nr:signal peptidase II [Myxococcales bacterium]
MKKHRLFALVALATIALDQGTKQWVLAALPLRESIEVIGGLFHLTHVTNPGAAFGFLAWVGETWRIPFFVVVSILATGMILAFYAKTRADQRLAITAEALLLGGALGNLYDRVVYGHVVDFLDFFVDWGGRIYHWPTFNIADVAITVGVALLLLDMLFQKEPIGPDVSPARGSERTAE